jgi:hypothetical protein
MKNQTKTLTLTLVFAALATLLSVGCTKTEAPKPTGTPVPKMAPGQAAGMQYMRQNGGNPQAGQAGQGGR